MLPYIYTTESYRSYFVPIFTIYMKPQCGLTIVSNFAHFPGQYSVHWEKMLWVEMFSAACMLIANMAPKDINVL